MGFPVAWKTAFWTATAWAVPDVVSVAAGTGVAAIARCGGIAEIGASRALERVAGRGGGVAQLGGCPLKNGSLEDGVLAGDEGVVRGGGVGGECPSERPPEGEVLRIIAQGQGNKEISASLNIAESTVKLHVNSLFDKLRVTSRTGAMKVGPERGLTRLR